jgi:CHAT domain-containing protein
VPLSNDIRLPTTLQGEACSLRPRADLGRDRGSAHVEFVLQCGPGPVGSVWHLPQDGRPDRLRSVADLLRDPRLAGLSEVLHCPGTPPIKLAEARAVACRIKSGGWPAVVIIGPPHRSLKVAFGPPSALPAMVAAVGVSAGDIPSADALHRILTESYGAQAPIASASEHAQMRARLRDARVANSEGRDADAERLLRLTLDAQQSLLNESDPALAQTLLDLALSVGNQGRPIEAETLIRQAEPILERSPSASERARLDLYRGFNAAHSGRFPEAARFAASAASTMRSDSARGELADVLSATEATGGGAERPPPSPGELILALNLQAAMSLRLGALEAADAAASEALRRVDETPDSPPAWKTEILLTLGRISSARGRISAAETYLRAALVTERSISGESTRSRAALAALGEAYQRESMLVSVLLAYRELGESLRAPSGPKVTSIPSDWLLPYAAALTSHVVSVNDPADRQALLDEFFVLAWHAAPERLSRTREQIDRERELRDPQYARRAQSLRDAQRELDLARQALALESARPDAARSRIAESELEAQERAARARYAQATTNLAGRAQEKNTPNAAALRERLAAEEAVILYLPGDQESFALVIRRAGSKLVHLPKARRLALEADVAELRRGLQAEGGQLRDFDLDLAHRLAQAWFLPLEPALAGVSRIAVIAEGALAALPLGILTTQASAPGDYSSAPWLLRRYAFSHVPALADLTTRRDAPGRSQPRPRPALALAVADWTHVTTARPDSPKALDDLAAACRSDAPINPQLLAGLPSLPDVSAELAALSNRVTQRGGQLTTRLNRDATEASLGALPLQDFGLLYFASHAVLPGSTRCLNQPAIALAPSPSAARQRSEDGLLEASEIAALRLDADLVVLSACNTASGAQGQGGESLSSLAHAFFSAGAQRVLASHWAIDSRATAALMHEFFDRQRAADFSDVSQALQNAQLALAGRASTAHPLYWGAFTVLTGMVSGSVR